MSMVKKRGSQGGIERKLSEVAPKPSPPVTAIPAESPQTLAAAQAALPLFDPAADQPKELFVWDMSKGIH